VFVVGEALDDFDALREPALWATNATGPTLATAERDRTEMMDLQQTCEQTISGVVCIRGQNES
jgi:hypothetical protein